MLRLPSLFSARPDTGVSSQPAQPRPEPPATTNPQGRPSGLFASLSPARRTDPFSSNTAAALAPRTNVLWTPGTSIQDMASLSDEREKRLFNKSASQQYLYAKSLSPAQRGDLERALETKFQNPDNPQAKEALTMWLSVQHARLRSHDEGQRAQLYLNRSGYYASPSRPEYAAAFDNFMRVIGDSSLSMELRMAAAQKLAYHARREGTIAREEASLLRQRAGTAELDSNAIPDGEPYPKEVAGAFALAASGHRLSRDPGELFESVEDDVAALTKPLGQQIKTWLREAGDTTLKKPSSFDQETNAASFARLLERRLTPAAIANATVPSRHALAKEGATVIHAIAHDAQLRAKVFAMAETALGTCGDNVAEGFSSIVREVRNHQMAEAVRQGVVGSAELNDWGRKQFRLHALETEVHRFLNQAKVRLEEKLKAAEELALSLLPEREHESFVQSLRENPVNAIEDLLCGPRLISSRNQQTMESLQSELHTLRESSEIKEPLEIMLHAKVALGPTLGLTDEVAQGMTHQAVSTLTDDHLKAIESAVLAGEADQQTMKDFLLNNETWLAGMKQLHAAEFKALDERFDRDPFHDLDLPSNGAERKAYLDAANDFERRKHEAETSLLLRCAGLPAPKTLQELMAEDQEERPARA